MQPKRKQLKYNVNKLGALLLLNNIFFFVLFFALTATHSQRGLLYFLMTFARRKCWLLMPSMYYYCCCCVCGTFVYYGIRRNYIHSHVRWFVPILFHLQMASAAEAITTGSSTTNNSDNTQWQLHGSEFNIYALNSYAARKFCNSNQFDRVFVSYVLQFDSFHSTIRWINSQTIVTESEKEEALARSLAVPLSRDVSMLSERGNGHVFVQ